MPIQRLHFDKDGIRYHALYNVKETSGSFHWTKVFGSEEPCDCIGGEKR